MAPHNDLVGSVVRSARLCFNLASGTPCRWDGRTIYGHEDKSNGRKRAKGANHMVKGGLEPKHRQSCAPIQQFRAAFGPAAFGRRGNKKLGCFF